MLTLNDRLCIPNHVSFTFIEGDAVLLDMHTSQYYLLDDVGARLWDLLQQGKTLRESYQVLLGEYDVEPFRLEMDILELLENLRHNGLVEIVQP